MGARQRRRIKISGYFITYFIEAKTERTYALFKSRFYDYENPGGDGGGSFVGTLGGTST